MSSPSFLVRLRSRSRRPEADPRLVEVPPAADGTRAGDHWHAGDPRVPAGALALRSGALPAPRRPVDRRGLVVVPEVDLRHGGVVDLRPVTAPLPAVDATRAAPGAPAAAPATAPAPAPEWSETSTWLG